MMMMMMMMHDSVENLQLTAAIVAETAVSTDEKIYFCVCVF